MTSEYFEVGQDALVKAYFTFRLISFNEGQHLAAKLTIRVRSYPFTPPPPPPNSPVKYDIDYTKQSFHFKKKCQTHAMCHISICSTFLNIPCTFLEIIKFLLPEAFGKKYACMTSINLNNPNVYQNFQFCYIFVVINHICIQLSAA